MGPDDGSNAGGGPAGPRGVQVPPDLVRACAIGDCVLFAGSGIGAQAGLPTWRQALEELLNRAERRQPAGDWKDLRLALDENQGLVVELIGDRVPREDLIKDVADIYERPLEQLPPTLDLLARIPFAGTITSTWDRLLERAFAHRSPEVLSPRDDFSALQLRERRYFILKLFGDPHRPETFLFTPDEYSQALEENPGASRALTSLVMSNVILFAGTSLDGIETFLSGLRVKSSAPTRVHFALVPWQSDLKIQEERFLNRYGLRILGYDSSEGHREVGFFLQSLRDGIRDNAYGDLPEERRPTLNTVRLNNIGPFRELNLSVAKGWNVILGNNGCGKSSLLEAIGLGLVGEAGQSIGPDGLPMSGIASRLLRFDASSGFIELVIGSDLYRTDLVRDGPAVVVKSKQLAPLQTGTWLIMGFPPIRGVTTRNPTGPVASTASDPVLSDIFPLIAGAVDQRMDDLKQWVVNAALLADDPNPDDSSPIGTRYRRLRDSFFRLMGEITPGLRLEFNRIRKETWDVMVMTDDGEVPIDLISQGTSSVLGWAGTLLQRMYEVHPTSEHPEWATALVLVDEIDAHMHPEWQRSLIATMKELFPNLQVIATTHSPLIVGNMEPGEVIQVKRDPEEPAQISVEPVEGSFQGLRADQILTSQAFGLDSTLDAQTANRVESYEQLLGQEDLTPQEEHRLKQLAFELEETIPSSPETAEAREARDLVRRWLSEQLQDRPSEQRRRIIATAMGYVRELEDTEGEAKEA
jgi:AAA domain, putative AbiEii toxin, Type IV TA system/SIR2-like domain